MKVQGRARPLDPDAERRLREAVASAEQAARRPGQIAGPAKDAPSSPVRRLSLAQRLFARMPQGLNVQSGLPRKPVSLMPAPSAAPLPPQAPRDEIAEPPPDVAAVPLPPSMRRRTEIRDSEGVLSAWAIGKSYKGRQVVKDVSLSVRRGEAVGLLGANGAGKTTAFYMITGLVPADKGRIVLDGQDITGLPMYRRARLGIGYLPQEASIFRGLNVEDNIRAVLEVVEPSKARREDQLNALLAEFNIEALRKAPATALSGGERRRLEIARALAGQPSFVLLDEPFAGIDPIAVGDIQDLVRQLTARGIGVLITDHNVRETLGLIDRAYIMHSGQLLMEGTPEEIVASEDVRRTYLGADFRL